MLAVYQSMVFPRMVAIVRCQHGNESQRGRNPQVRQVIHDDVVGNRR